MNWLETMQGQDLTEALQPPEKNHWMQNKNEEVIPGHRQGFHTSDPSKKRSSAASSDEKKETLTCRRGRVSWGFRSRRQRSWGRGRGGWGAWKAAPPWLNQWRSCRPPGSFLLPPSGRCQWQTLPGTCDSRPSWNRAKQKKIKTHIWKQLNADYSLEGTKAAIKHHMSPNICALLPWLINI